MDGRGECCIAQYAGGGVYDMSKVDRIMLKFRPIAPKPPSAGSSSSSGSSPEMSEVSPRSGRGKRRCNNGGATKRTANNNSRRKKVPAAADTVVTLPLLPETPDRREISLPSTEFSSAKRAVKEARWLSFGGNAMTTEDYYFADGQDRTAETKRREQVAGSCVTVECITDTWVDEDGIGCTDEERRWNLEGDTCPGIVTDGYGRVVWTNDAYKKMVLGESGCCYGRGDEVAVWFVMKETVPAAVAMGCQRAFTCRVRVQNHRNGGKSSVYTAPCDAWRMDGGGFAWRLDVKAALCLGR